MHQASRDFPVFHFIRYLLWRPLVAGVLLLPWLTAFASAPVSVAPGRPDVAFVASVDWLALLEATGVSTVLEQAQPLIQQEIAHLEKAPLGFSPEALQTLRQQWQERLGSTRLKQDVIARLQRQVSPEQALQVQAVVQSPRLKFLQTLQAQLGDEAVRERLRAYRVQVRETVPSPDRLTLFALLERQLGRTALETDLKVELRKQVLARVSRQEDQDAVPEALLETQLQNYRQELEQQIGRAALDEHLYLFKNTPTPQVQALVRTLDQPAFNHFLDVCREAVKDSFRAARAEAEPRLVGN